MLEIHVSVASSTLTNLLGPTPTVFVEDTDIPIKLEKLRSKGWVIMVCQRPITGTDGNVAIGNNAHGRHWAAMNPMDEFFEEKLRSNEKLDARVAVVLTGEQLVRMALIGNRYADKYREMELDNALKLLKPKIDKLEGKKYSEVMELLKQAEAGYGKG